MPPPEQHLPNRLQGSSSLRLWKRVLQPAHNGKYVGPSSREADRFGRHSLFRRSPGGRLVAAEKHRPFEAHSLTFAAVQVQAFSADASRHPSTDGQPQQRHFSAAFEPFVDLDGGAPSIFETFTPVQASSASVHSPSSFAASALQ